MNFEQMQAQVETIVQQYVDSADRVSGDKIGLDPRAGMVYVTDECIFAHKDSNKSLRYYGGFEYVGNEYVSQIGDYVFYMLRDEYDEECRRVADAIDFFNTEAA